nr:G-protein coupled receptor GRL101-like [Crassostrea gigas]
MKMSRNKTWILDSSIDKSLSASDSNGCKTGDCCPLCASIDSEYSCPTNCTSSGLSFNCTSDSSPVYTTSLTASGLVQDALVFNDSFSNLRQVSIINCKLNLFKIDSKLTIQTLTIRNSSIGIVDVDELTSSLRLVRFDNCMFDSVKFTTKYGVRFNFFVHRSSLRKIFYIVFGTGALIDFSETDGFPYSIPFELVGVGINNIHTIVNLSSCNLKRQPSLPSRIMTLDLSHNYLYTWSYSAFFQCLHLQHNLIEEINFTSYLKTSEAQLHFLDLSYNMIKVIREHDFVDLPNLLQLIMRNNRLEDIHENAFAFITKLQGLDLSSNNLHSLNRNHFLRLSNLRFLDLQNNNIKVVEGMFDGLIRIEYLRVDTYTLCCAQPKTVGKIQCTAPVNEISSCNNLIDIPLLSTMIWYIALFAVFGNVFNPFYRGILQKSQNLKFSVIYAINLCVADFLMGVYMFIIAGANLKFSGRYGFEDEWWRHSHICTVAGVLATLSSEASVLFLLLITIDRILTIRSQFSRVKKNSWISIVMSTFVWILSFMLSLLPLFGSDYFEDYYSSSGVCISLPLSIRRRSGWEYSMILFVGANSLIFIAISLGQLVIFCYVRQMGKDNYLQQRTEVILTKTLKNIYITLNFTVTFFLHAGLLTFTGFDVTPQEYAWIIVVVLPINSALNPIIYTVLKILRWIR